MKRFLNGIMCGIGGVSPGLSGSVMLVISGYYDKTIECMGSFFKNPKQNFKFLFPLFSGIALGILLFGKVVSLLLANFEMITRLTFLGFVLGTIPLFHKKLKEKDFNNKYYILVILMFIIGTLLIIYNSKFNQVYSLTSIQSVGLGLILSASTIIPGVDNAVLLSSLGIYEIFIEALATLDLTILVPAVLGGGAGILFFSAIISYLIKNYHTLTYSLIFGLFLSMIPSVINSSVVIGFNLTTLVSFIFMIIGILISYKMSTISEKEVY